MIQVVSIEDDLAEETLLEEMLARYASDHGLEISVVHFSEAAPLLERDVDCDLIFMDIDLPGMNGMEAAALLRGYDAMTPLVFITSLAQFAVRGYEVDATGFIVKPVRYYDLVMCMNKVMRIIHRNASEAMSVRASSGVIAFPIGSLSYVETVGHDLVYRFASGEDPVRVRDSLANVESRLVDKPFIRISQSQLVNMEHIAWVRGDELHMSSGETLYFSRRRKKDCMALIAKYLGRTI